MKRLISWVLCLLLICAFVTAYASVSAPVVYCDGTKVKSQKIYEYDLADGKLTITWNDVPDASKFYYKCIGLNEEPDFTDPKQSSKGTTLAEKTVTSHTTASRKFTIATNKMEEYDYLKIAIAAYDSDGVSYWLNFGVELTDSDKIVTAPALKCDGSSVDSRELVEYDLADGKLTIKWTPQSAADHYYYKCIGLNEEPDFTDPEQSNKGTTLAQGTVTSNTTTKCKFTLTTDNMEGYSYLKIAVAAYDSDGKDYWTNFGVQLKDSNADEMMLSDTSLSFAYSGDSDTVTVSGASSFTVSYPTEDVTVAGDKWLTVAKSGSSIKISARANYSASSRSETITVKSSDGQTKTIKVKQAAGYSAPTASLKIGSTSYNSGDTYGPLANGGEDTLWLTISVKNARRIHVASGSYDIGSKTLNVASSSTAAAHDCAIAIPEGVAPGTYTFTIYVSNSDVENDKWNQAITPITLKVNIISTSASTDTSFDPIWPCASSYKVTCLYYYKTGEVHLTRYGKNTAIDIGGSGNIVAVEDGVVTKKEDLGTASFGKYIEITHNDGTVTLYAHLASFASSVSVGAKVTQGQVIGVMGNTGNSGGTHLHFEMKGKNPFLDIYYDMYKRKVSFEKNVYSNNNSFNSDKRICEIIEDEYTLSNGWYTYTGDNSNPTTAPAVNGKTSTKGVNFIKSYEGLRLTKYEDAAGKLTIGYGHLIKEGESFPDAITEAEAVELLRKDLLTAESVVNDFVAEYGITLNQNQYDALVSMAYNLYSQPFTTDCKLRSLLIEYKNGSDVPAWMIYNALARWHHVKKNGVYIDIAGLYYRRMNEAKIFTSGVYSTSTWEIPSWLVNNGSGPSVPDEWYSDYVVNPSTKPATTTPANTPAPTPAPVTAGTPVFNGYTALSVKEYDLANGTLTITWNATNATKYYVSAILLNERPVTTDSEQSLRAVKTIKNGTYSRNTMTLSVDDLTGGQYLKFAVGSAASGENDYHWSWVGFKLTDSTEVPDEPDEPEVPDEPDGPNDTGIERVTLSAVSGMDGKPGETVTIPISINNPDAVPLGSITVVFDLPSGVTVSEATLCGNAVNASAAVDNQMVWITSMSSGITGSGKIADLTLKLDTAVSLPAAFNMNVEICHVTEQLYANPPSVAIRIEGKTNRTPGDVNLDGKINSLDAFAVLKYSVGYPIQINTANADVNADGKINSLDAFTILKYSVGYPVTLK